jgi:nicotinamide mononucleotide transporter
MSSNALDALWRPAFTLAGSPVTWAEIVAVVLSLWMVERNMRVRALAWPLAIAASLLYFFLFRRVGLYGEAALQLMFVAVAAWGWWQWRYGTADGRPLVVRHLPVRGRWIVAGLTLLAWPVVGALLDRHTDSTVAYADALPTVASVTGQWLLARKYVQTWPTWLVVNVYSVGLFAHKALWVTAALYAVFAVLSVAGWRAWRRLEREAA